MSTPHTISSPSSRVCFISNPLARLYRLRRSVYNAGEDIDESLPGHVAWFVTLTYKEVSGWQPGHIRDFLQRVRVWLARKGHKFHYVWVAELQKRGAVHYHLIIWLPYGLSMPQSDRRKWWVHGSTNTVVAKKRVGYLMKYTSKGTTAFGPKFPKGIRIYGFSKHFDTTPRRVAYFRAPKWLRAKFSDYKNCYLVRKTGFWLDKLTGECFDPPCRYAFYRYDHLAKGVILVACPDGEAPYTPERIDEVIAFYSTILEFSNAA